MDNLLVKAGGWLLLVFLAFVAMVMAADGGFAATGVGLPALRP